MFIHTIATADEFTRTRTIDTAVETAAETLLFSFLRNLCTDRPYFGYDIVRAYRLLHAMEAV